MLPAPHHRFAVHGRYAQLTLAVEASLSAPWTVLFGPSGSGKTTLLRALAGVVGPALEVVFDRQNRELGSWQSLAAQAPENRRLAYAPQQSLLLPHLTVAANVRFAEDLHGISRDQSLVPELIELLSLQPLLGKQPQRLSGGEQQRVALARALAVPNAALLLLDEPFAGLDRALRDALVPRLKAHLTARNLPVLSVTHDPDEALLLQAEVLRFQDGRFTAQGPARAVLADEMERLRRLL